MHVTSFMACLSHCFPFCPSAIILVDAQVHHQRYLLQPSALEIFLADRSNALLNLPSSEVCRRFSFAMLTTLRFLALR